MKAGSEWARIDLLRAVLSRDDVAHVLYGIGDDAAVLEPVPGLDPTGAAGVTHPLHVWRNGDGPLVWTIDSAVEGVHFRRDLMSFEDLGYRATMAAASDLAAMGATPLGLLAAVVLPLDVSDDALRAIAIGQRAACDALGTAILGGNLSRGGELSITTTALGAAPAPLRRDGARPGDTLALAGPVGLAAAGLALIERGITPSSAAAERAVQAFRRPAARIDAGRHARSGGRAAIDVSDGLAADVAHLVRASGVRALLDPKTLVSADLAEVAALLGVDALDLALHGGEDYAIVVASPNSVSLLDFVPIGRCALAEEGASDVALLGPDGVLIAVSTRGFDHFA